MTNFNLAAPGNEQMAYVVQCQKIASHWLAQLRANKVNRHWIREQLAQIKDPDEREEIRKWLNQYRKKE